MKLAKIFAIAVILLTQSACANTNQSFKKREASKNFRDGKFHNTKVLENKSLIDVIKMRLSSDWSEWPEWIDIKKEGRPVSKISDSSIRVTFINHASLLIQSDGLNILTDPIFSERASPFSFIGPKRVHKPGIEFEDLPRIDVVLISHDHYDHLDLDTINRLVKRNRPKIFTGLGVGERLESLNNVYELDWWQSYELPKMKVTFVEVQHFSGRSLSDKFSTLWGGYVLELSGKKIYFGGDSGYADHYKKTYERFGPMNLSLLPIGAYAPRWMMKDVHLNPMEAVQAHIDLKSKKSIGMHYGTFQLTAEPREQPKKWLKAESKKAGLNLDEFITLSVGEPHMLFSQ